MPMVSVLGSEIGGEEALGRSARCRVGQRLGHELAGILAVLQLVDRPGRQPDAEGAVMVLAGLAVARPVIRCYRTGEMFAGLAVGGSAPAQRVLVEADDADQVRRLPLDDNEPVFLRSLPEHGCGAVEIPGGAGVIPEAVGLVAPGPRVGRGGGLQIHYPLAMRGQVIGSRLTRNPGLGVMPCQGYFSLAA